MIVKFLVSIKDWLAASHNRRIFLAMLIVATVTALTKVLSVAKELVVAKHFGTSEALDAFLVAILLPMLVVSILAGSFGAAMMPTYISVRSKYGKVESNKLFSSVVALSLILMLLVGLLLALSAPVVFPLLASGFSDATLELTLSLFYYMLPIIFCTGISQLYATAINAGERFAIVALAPAMTPLCVIVALELFLNAWDVYSLAYGTLVGAVVEMFALAWMAYCRGIPVLPLWRGITDEIKVVMHQYTPMVAGALLMSGTLIVDNAMAATLEPGSVATLNYSNRIVAVILGIGSIAIGTAVLPHFSSMVEEKNWDGLRHTSAVYTKLIGGLSLALVIALVVSSESIVRLFFERGEFSSEDTVEVGKAQVYYALQIPFYLLGTIGIKVLSALRRNEVLMKIAIVNLSVNIVGNYVLMQYLGVLGIALSTSIVYFVSFVLIYISVSKKLAYAEENAVKF